MEGRWAARCAARAFDGVAFIERRAAPHTYRGLALVVALLLTWGEEDLAVSWQWSVFSDQRPRPVFRLSYQSQS